MIKRRSLRQQVLILFGSLLVLSAAPAMAETYVAGMAGITVPQPSGIQFMGVTANEDTHGANSLMYGAKVGHYFASTPWLGIEGEVFNTTPHLKQQNFTVPGQGTFNVTGINNRVLTLAANVMARVPGETLQPYVGVGPALMFSRVKEKETGESDSAATVGVNALAGVRYLITKQLVVFVEAKYQHAKFNYSDWEVKANYNAFHGAFGLGFQF